MHPPFQTILPTTQSSNELPNHISRTITVHLYNTKVPEGDSSVTDLQGRLLERILRSKFTKMKIPIRLLPEQILRSNFTKTKMPLHSLPERILITKFYKTECQYTHCQNEV